MALSLSLFFVFCETWCSKIHEVTILTVGCCQGMLNSSFCFGAPPQSTALHLIQKIVRILSLMNQSQRFLEIDKNIKGVIQCISFTQL